MIIYPQCPQVSIQNLLIGNPEYIYAFDRIIEPIV
jgi:hypothetical protein